MICPHDSSNTRIPSLTLLLAATLAGCGGGGGGSPAPANSPPQIPATSLTTNEDVAGSTSFVVSDGDGDPLTATITTQPTRGTATLAGTNPFTVTYLPAPDQNGADSLRVTVSDGRGGSASGTVNITVNPQPDTPAFAAQNFNGTEDTPLAGQLAATDADGDALSFTVLTPPAHGSLTLAPDGGFTFAGDAEFNGADSFEAQVSDGVSTRAATVSLTVVAVNDPPVVVDDFVNLPSTAPVLVDVLLNDTDIDSDTLLVSILDQPAGAIAEVTANRIRLIAYADAAGPSSLRYEVNDGANSRTATLQMTIGAVRPLFYFTGEARTPERRIRRYDFVENIELETPVPAGEALEAFTVSADARKLVYVTRAPLPIRHRLWLRDLENLAAPVQEITTPSGFFRRDLKLSPDGTLVAFNEFLASTATPGQSTDIEGTGADIQNPTFTRDSRTLFYTHVPAGGGPVIKRASVSAAAAVSNRTQMTQSFMVPGQGFGPQFRLTPDESRLVSIGRLPAPMLGAKQYAFLTTADGSMDDTRIHQEFTDPLDGTNELPDLTTDGRYAVFRSTFAGVGGVYVSDLQSPGTQSAIAVDPPYVGAYQAVGTDRVIFGTNSATPGNYNWQRTGLVPPRTYANFNAATLPSPRLASAAPDGSRVLIDRGSLVFSEQFLADGSSSGMSVGQLPDADPVPARFVHSPDSASAVVLGQAGLSGLVVNPKLGGWSLLLNPAPAMSFSDYCVAYAGQGCF